MEAKGYIVPAPRYRVIVERDVKIVMSDGVKLDATIFRPDSEEKFPVIVGAHPYSQEGQLGPVPPTRIVLSHDEGVERSNASLESGDPYFFARRGYVYINVNVRGTGKSEGLYDMLSPREVQDVFEVIEWAAKQPWSSGSVGMFGISYYAMLALRVAALNPPHLRCVFAPWGLTDLYRDRWYHGGILNYGFLIRWARTSLKYGRARPKLRSIDEMGEEGFRRAVEEMLSNEEIASVPELVEALKNPFEGANPLIVDVLLHPLDGPYWDERRPKLEDIKIPVYLGADWSNYALHLPGALRAWEEIKAPKKLIIGPPAYLDRPLYQLQVEALRFFDYWLKGIDTGIMKEPPVRIYVMGANDWKESTDWPIPGTKWIPFYLHDNGLLWDHDPWPDVPGADTFFDSPWHRGYLEYISPPFVEPTEVVGPLLLVLYASTSDTEVLWHVSFFHIDKKGRRWTLSRGWLRGSHREIDPTRSKPWEPYYTHKRSSPLKPGEVYEFRIPIRPTAVLFRPGTRMGIRISCSDEPLDRSNLGDHYSYGHVKRHRPSRITIYREEGRPSHLLVPIARGNILGTFISGGRPYMDYWIYNE